MKIVLVSSLYGLDGGGVGLITQQLADGLVRAGHTVVVITSGGVKGQSVEFNLGVKVHTFSPANLYLLHDKDTRPLWQKIIWQLIDIYNPFVKKTLREILEHEKPDVIHIHKMRGFSGALWPVASMTLPGRVIQTCHDFESMSPRGTLDGRVGRWAIGHKWPIREYQSVRGRLSRGVNIVTAPSVFALDTITKSGLFPAAQRHVIPNAHGWTSMELDTFRKNGMQTDDVNLLYLGRLEPEKGLRELCSAFVLAASHLPTLYLTIAGWGTLEAELFEKYGAHPRIHFGGKVHGEAKNHLLAKASVLVVPSTCAESFGIVVLEAFAFGKPVIASRVGGLPELVREGETGWLVPPGDINALAQTIESAAQKPSFLQQMALACFDMAKQYTLDKMIQNYENLYAHLLEKK